MNPDDLRVLLRNAARDTGAQLLVGLRSAALLLDVWNRLDAAENQLKVAEQLRDHWRSRALRAESACAVARRLFGGESEAVIAEIEQGRQASDADAEWEQDR